MESLWLQGKRPEKVTELVLESESVLCFVSTGCYWLENINLANFFLSACRQRYQFDPLI